MKKLPARECVFHDHADDLADDPRFEKKVLGLWLQKFRPALFVAFVKWRRGRDSNPR